MSDEGTKRRLQTGGNSKRLKTSAGLGLLLVCWVAMEAPTIRHGCDLTDFGQAATIAHRLAHGDRPFVDSIHSTVTLSEYYASWLFRLMPNATLLDLRIANSVVAFASYAAVFLLLCGLTKPSLALLCTAASMPVVRSWFTQVPTYHTLPATAAIMSIALYSAALRRPESHSRYGLAFVGGIVGALAATCRLPLLGLAALPAAALAPAWIAGAGGRRALALPFAYLIGFMIFLGLVAGLVIQAGLGSVAIERYLMLTSRGEYGSESITLLRYGLRDFLMSGVVAANYLAVFVLLMSAATAWVPRWLRVALAMAAAIIFARYLGMRDTHTARIMGFGLVGVTLSLLTWWPRHGWSIADRRLAVERSFLCLAAVYVMILFLAGSNTGQNALVHVSHLSIALSILLILELPKRMHRLGKPWFLHATVNRATAVGVVAAVVLASLHCWVVYGSYRDTFSVRQPERQAAFRSAALAGITSTASRVASVDRLVEYVRQRVRPGGYLLAYYDIPLVYFATGTRPAACASWMMEAWPATLEHQVLADMLARSRIPELVIRNRVFPGRKWPAHEAGNQKNYTDDTYACDDPQGHPINAWVEANYALADRIGPFEIWSPRTAGTSDNAGRAQLLAATDDPIDDQ